MLAGIVVIVGTSARTVGAASVSRLPLHVLLTISSNLNGVARSALIAETERIWRPEHVEIEWAQSARTNEHPDAPLRVLVVTRPKMAARDGNDWPVAELFPEAVPRAVAVASIEGAQRVVDEATRDKSPVERLHNNYRLGLVLGRAIAHEIGHFLLSTGTHAGSGLMRASVDAREFAAVRGNAFRQDRNASEWLRQR
jgi:hypothetical protein